MTHSSPSLCAASFHLICSTPFPTPQYILHYIIFIIDHNCIFYDLHFAFSDLWGLVTLGIATSYYLKFNAVMYFNLEEEAPSSLYLYGDYWYVVNSLVYTLCAMRDNECFWFMPTNGRPPAFLDIAKAHYFSNVDEKVFVSSHVGIRYGKCHYPLCCFVVHSK